MKTSYKYVDPDNRYTDPATGVLRNKANISDEELLLNFESLHVAKRTEELQSGHIKIVNSSSLLEIHKHLFQDVYEWAGQVRTVEISKGGRPFFPLSRFSTAFAHIDTLIAEFQGIPTADKQRIAKKLAEILDSVNYLHPFREGNGRAQREFVRLLAFGKGISLNLNPPDSVDVYERYMNGTINGDVNVLTKLILELMQRTES